MACVRTGAGSSCRRRTLGCLSAVSGRLCVLSGRYAVSGAGGWRPTSRRRLLPESVCAARPRLHDRGVSLPPQQGTTSTHVTRKETETCRRAAFLLSLSIPENQSFWFYSSRDDLVRCHAAPPSCKSTTPPNIRDRFTFKEKSVLIKSFIAGSFYGM